MARVPDSEYVEFVQVALPRLRRTAFLVCGDWHRAEDACQEALVRLYRHWRRVERREGLMAWCRRTTVRILVDESRRPWRREVASERLPEPRGLGSPGTSTEDRDAVLAALRALPPRRRACVVLRYYEDLSVAETAAALGCSPGTVKSQTSDALASLRSLLADDFERRV